METDQINVLETILEQSWEQIRHVENNRLWFTNMYFLVVAGVLTYLFTQTSTFINTVFLALMSFLLAFSIFGLIFCFRVDDVDNAYCEAIKNITKSALNMEENHFRKYMGFLIVKKRKGQSISCIYKSLYVLSILIWSCFVAYSIYTINSGSLSIISASVN